jgi:CRISPR/Cas system CMR subunit Cmr6 (Cas7 group RAMP superfamily)
VMNPHYAPYYQGTQPPADYHNPGFSSRLGQEASFSLPWLLVRRAWRKRPGIGSKKPLQKWV